MDRELIVTKKTLQAASAAHSLHTNYGIKQALGAAEQGANLQTLVKTSLNVATTEILLPAAIMGERSANAATNWNGNFHQVLIFCDAILSDFPCCKIDVNSNMLEVILMLYSQQQMFIFICISISYTFAETKDTLLCYDVTGSLKIKGRNILNLK